MQRDKKNKSGSFILHIEPFLILPLAKLPLTFSPPELVDTSLHQRLLPVFPETSGICLRRSNLQRGFCRTLQAGGEDAAAQERPRVHQLRLL